MAAFGVGVGGGGGGTDDPLYRRPWAQGQVGLHAKVYE